MREWIDDFNRADMTAEEIFDSADNPPSPHTGLKGWLGRQIIALKRREGIRAGNKSNLDFTKVKKGQNKFHGTVHRIPRATFIFPVRQR